MRLFHLAFYVPVDHAEAVKQAMFAAGAGRVGAYDCCSWETLGQGQFRPLAGANPFLGKEGEVERVAELKVETVCNEYVLPGVIAAIRQAHPYEEVAWMAMPLMTESDLHRDG